MSGSLNGPEVRIDQLTGARVLLAPARSDRPEAMAAPERELKGSKGCPFCEGNEDRTPEELFAVRPGAGQGGSGDGEAGRRDSAACGANQPGWQVRSVPNLYPALATPEVAGGSGSGAGGASAARPGGAAATSGEPAGAFSSPADPLRASARSLETDLFSARPATGTHEVIISAPEHVTALCELTDEHFAITIEAWRERMRHHRAASPYTQLIVNEGLAAGASLEHSHAQLYALGFVPAAVARERERVASYAERTAGGELLIDVLSEEVRRADRLVAIDDEAALICPWASRSPYEMRVIPRRTAPDFATDRAGSGMLATALRLLTGRFGRPPPLNLWIRTAPRDTETFQWHIDLAPRLTTPAGFELSTEIFINVVSPEQAAAELREYV